MQSIGMLLKGDFAAVVMILAYEGTRKGINPAYQSSPYLFSISICSAHLCVVSLARWRMVMRVCAILGVMRYVDLYSHLYTMQ